MKTLRHIGIALCLILPAHFAAAQANVNESLETISYWVDTNTGSDSNPGTQALPFKTIGYAATQAVANNQAGKGIHVWIDNGTYRESVSLTGSTKDTTLPITFEAVNHGQVVVSGSVVYTGWTQYSGNSSIYTTAWNNTWGVCATVPGCPASSYPQPDIMLRQEMVAVNGTVLTEVLSEAQMQPGTFSVDTTNKLIYVWPPSKTTMGTATVEVATEPTIFSLAGKSNIVIRGLVFQYANSCRSAPAVSVTGSPSFPPTNILIDSDTFQWNNGQGLAIDNPTTYFTVENSTATHNGDSGFQSYDTQYGLWQNDFAGYDNWRGAQGAYYACNVAGFHPWAAHNDTLSGFTTQYNQAYGVHWDDDNVSISGSGIIASENLLSGLFAEKDPGPISITSSYVCNQTSPISGAGFGVRNSEGVSITHSVLYNNAVSQIAVIGQAGGIEVTDWLNGQTYNLITQGLVNTNNTIEGIGSTQLLFSDGSLNGSDWLTFLLGFDSNENTWYNADNSTTEFVVPTPNLYSSESLAGWQVTTLQDLGSKFEQPSGSPQNTCNVSADANDYWIVASAPSSTLNAAGQATFDLTVMPLLKFSGTVKFSLDGISEVPGFSASSVSSVTTSGTTSLTVSATTSSKTGTYPVTVIGNSGNTTHTVTVEVVVPTTQVRLSTGQITFPTQQQGTTSSGQSFTLTNTGKSSLTMSGVTASKDFAVSSNNCGNSVAAGKSCTVTITFTPAAAATINGTVTLTDSDSTGTQAVALTGTGIGPPIVTLSPHSLSFGGVEMNSSSAQSITLTNIGQNALTLGKGAFALTGTDPGDYSQTNTCGSSVATNASCTVTVTFKPKSSGSRPASLTITDNANSSPQTVTLNGSGAYPTATLTPSNDNFGSINIGSSSTAKVSTLTNTSSLYTLNVNSITITGTNASDFSQTNTCPVGQTLAAKATCTISVTFKPSATGTRTATLTETDNTSVGSHTITLTGTGKN